VKGFKVFVYEAVALYMQIMKKARTATATAKAIAIAKKMNKSIKSLTTSLKIR